MVSVATLLGVKHYKTITGSSSNKYRTTNIATFKKKSVRKEKSDNNQCLYSSEDRMED